MTETFVEKRFGICIDYKNKFLHTDVDLTKPAGPHTLYFEKYRNQTIIFIYYHKID